MANKHLHLHPHLSLPFILLLILQNPTQVPSQPQHSSFIFNGFHNSSDLLFDGSPKTLPNGLLQLTNLTNDQIGHAFFKLPLHFPNPGPSDRPRDPLSSLSFSFSTTFAFAMVPERPDRGGQGLAFVISPDFRINGAYPAEYFGLFNDSTNGLSSNRVFAVEFDVGHSLQFKDIDANHVGIDVNGLQSIDSASAAYFTDQKQSQKQSFELLSGEPMQVWINYNGSNNQIDVAIAPLGIPRPIHPLLSKRFDLSRVFAEEMYVGFSASNGGFCSSHYILGWSFSRNGVEAQELELSSLPKLPKTRNSKKHVELVIGLSLAMLVVVLVGFVSVLFVRRRRRRYVEVREDWEQEFGPHRFSYKDLYRATKGFKESELLGSGGFGKVYKGLIQSTNTQVAIKRVSHNSKQGMKEFIAEIASLGRLSHRNMVHLLGYSRLKGELLLVYDYMPNGSLDRFLYGTNSTKLKWDQRFRIIKNVASALLYLHQEWEQVVLHRDVKASNVLLDVNFNGRLGDFGLARLYDHGSNPDTTHVAGTVGYIAPELSRFGKATPMTDVFAFGAFILEVACGRRPIEAKEVPEKVVLVDWVYECWKNEGILGTRDAWIGDEYVVEEMELVLKLGLLCSHSVPSARPTMSQVVHYLDGDAPLPDITLQGWPVGMPSDVASDGFSSNVVVYSSSQSLLTLNSARSTDT
ncbi:hypothetical protein Scep_005424 [Stephania cephalantha]|uniref:non-specific serine/threonine protein kinase n=1 Tax=Stephania cephalantha TaxID=152367 RepID=A0AAP0KWW0_9MAGN